MISGVFWGRVGWGRGVGGKVTLKALPLPLAHAGTLGV